MWPSSVRCRTAYRHNRPTTTTRPLRLWHTPTILPAPPTLFPPAPTPTRLSPQQLQPPPNHPLILTLHLPPNPPLNLLPPPPLVLLKLSPQPLRLLPLLHFRRRQITLSSSTGLFLFLSLYQSPSFIILRTPLCHHFFSLSITVCDLARRHGRDTPLSSILRMSLSLS